MATQAQPENMVDENEGISITHKNGSTKEKHAVARINNNRQLTQVDIEKQIKQNVGYDPLMDIEANGRNFTMSVNKLRNLRDEDLEAAFSKFGENFIKTMKSVRAMLNVDPQSEVEETTSVAVGDGTVNTNEVSDMRIVANNPPGRVVCRVVHITKKGNIHKYWKWGLFLTVGVGALVYLFNRTKDLSGENKLYKQKNNFYNKQ